MNHQAGPSLRISIVRMVSNPNCFRKSSLRCAFTTGLLFCCKPSTPMGGRGMTESIAACVWRAIAAEPGGRSFTNALIELLEEWFNRSFSAAMLHIQILSALRHERPERWGRRMVSFECPRTPVYILTAAEPGTPSINISRLQPTTVRDGIGLPAAQTISPFVQVDLGTAITTLLVYSARFLSAAVNKKIQTCFRPSTKSRSSQVLHQRET